MIVVRNPVKEMNGALGCRKGRDRGERQGCRLAARRHARSRPREPWIGFGHEGFKVPSLEFNALLTALDILDRIRYAPVTKRTALGFRWFNGDGHGAAGDVLGILLDGEGDRTGRGTLQYALSL